MGVYGLWEGMGACRVVAGLAGGALCVLRWSWGQLDHSCIHVVHVNAVRLVGLGEILRVFVTLCRVHTGK